MKHSNHFACFSLLAAIAFLLLCYMYSHPLSKSTDVPDFSLKDEVISASAPSPKPLALFASGACLMDAESGRILYGKAEQTPLPMASTTKIMTCLIALEQASGSERVSFSSRAASMPKVHLGASKGRSFSLQDLLYSLMLESHNDSAVAIAEHIGGSVEGFAAKMNQKAAELGLSDTHFITPNGLDADGHQSTPSDMCKLASYACQNKEFLALIQTPSKTIRDDKGHTYSLTNHDAFLSLYPGALGIKTGFTGKAGYCFVGAAKQGNLTLTSCVLASGWPPDKSRKWSDTKALMDYGFSHFKKQTITFQDFSQVPLRVTDGLEKQVYLRVPESIVLPTASFETVEIRYRLPSSVTAPILVSKPVGTIECRLNGSVYASYPVYTTKDIGKITFSHIIYEVFDKFLSVFCKK